MVGLPPRTRFRPALAAAAAAFLLFGFCRIDPCAGEDQTEDEETSLAEAATATHAAVGAGPPDWDALRAPTPPTRSERFPSVEHRVKLYASNWYSPPCENDARSFVEYAYSHPRDSDPDSDSDGARWPTLEVAGFRDHPSVNQTTRVMTDIQSVVEPDMLFFMDEGTVRNCANFSYDEDWGRETGDPYLERILFRHNMRMYCRDVEELLLPAWNHVALEERNAESAVAANAIAKANAKPAPPLLIQFGDNKQSHVYKDVQVPHIKKFRSAALSPSDLEDAVAAGSCRASEGDNLRKPLPSAHGTVRFQPIVWKLATDRHYRKLHDVYRYDTRWSRKKDAAIFRGQLTGSRDGYDKTKTDDENCRDMKRCRLVYNHANSSLVHAKLTSTRGRLPDVLNGVELLADRVKIDALLEYKGIIMIEGNDVASGLKWALLSQSVVLMPVPRHTSWCMEELLEPWVHYVPLDDFATNVEERMRWVVDHDAEAQAISERATLWMEDLVFHPDAAEDDRLVQEEILRRYAAHFAEAGAGAEASAE